MELGLLAVPEAHSAGRQFVWRNSFYDSEMGRAEQCIGLLALGSYARDYVEYKSLVQ